MRILVLAPKLMWPLSGGAEIRNYNLLRETAKNHEVHLLAFINHDDEQKDAEALKKFCESITTIKLSRPFWKKILNGLKSLVTKTPFILYEYFDQKMMDTLSEVVKNKDIDVIHAHFLHVGQYVKSKGGSAFVYDPHNLEHILWQRFAEVQTNPVLKLFSKLQYNKFVHWQQLVADNSEKIVTLSDTDKELYLDISPNAEIDTVPNGADIDYFEPQDIEIERNSILYFGNLSWEPQSEAAIYFHDEILPKILKELPDSKLYLVGNKPPQSLYDLQSDQVIITGFVDDIREYIARAAVVIMPLRVGAGTKHRIFQSLSMEKALVTTTVGAEGIDLVHRETALIADSEQDFASCVVEAMKDTDFSTMLGKNGRKLIVESHDWRSNYKILDDAFNQAKRKLI